jgi:hypothetical protein|tara:strand:- start:4578 stop:6470 length:1893 start_codon:yes stop_codon:yes gene_type:complete
MAYSKTTNLTPIKDIKYLNKDFNSFRDQLIEFTKTYYPNTFNDFSEGSPGMMFMEMAAYVGDVLSYYTDTQLQETFLDTAQERSNLFHLAYTLGYKPQVTAASSAQLEIFQLVPSKLSGDEYIPDYNYSITLNPPTSFNTNSGIIFNLEKKVDFAYSSSFDETVASVYQLDSNNNPQYFLLMKKTPVISAKLTEKSITIGALERFKITPIIDDKIISIQSVIDSDGNEWTEVPYLAQNTVFEELPNVKSNNPTLSEFQSETPYLLKLKKVPRRFTTRFTSEGILELHFGAGINNDKADEQIIPNPDNVGLGHRDGRSKLNEAYDPSNFLYTKTYGQVPSNTTLTVTYLKGGGISANVPSDTITNLETTKISMNPNLNGSLSTFCKESLACSNPEPARGGGVGDTIEDIRLNTVASFSAQQRTITKDDYMLRTLSLPAKFGKIAKAYITKDSTLKNTIGLNDQQNPFASNLYVLGYNTDKYLVNTNNATKTNLITYLNEFRPLTDSINIKDAFVINLGIDFEITTFKNTNNQEVLLNCISELKEYFNIDKWQINQPIISSEVYNLIAQVKGVQSVQDLTLKNLTGVSKGYSLYKYDFNTATKNDIIYPSMDPSIFEIKYPNQDIKGKITQF